MRRGRGGWAGRAGTAGRSPAALPLLSGAVLACLVTIPLGASGQVIQGRVLDDEDERPIAQASLYLQDEGGATRAATLSDAEGAYRLEAPGPGRYYLVAEHLSHETVRSHLLEVGEGAGPYRVDVGMRRVPIPLRGLTVTAERQAELERSIRLLIGLNPKALRWNLIDRARIESHLARGHRLTDLIRWAEQPGVTVVPGRDGPCFQARGRTCLPLFLNGVRMDPMWTEELPLEIAEVVVVLLPQESAAYPGGAILLYTAAWL